MLCYDATWANSLRLPLHRPECKDLPLEVLSHFAQRVRKIAELRAIFRQESAPLHPSSNK